MVDVDKLSKRTLLNNFKAVSTQNRFIEALLFFYAPEDPYFAELQDVNRERLLVDIAEIHKGREKDDVED